MKYILVKIICNVNIGIQQRLAKITEVHLIENKLLKRFL